MIKSTVYFFRNQVTGKTSKFFLLNCNKLFKLQTNKTTYGELSGLNCAVKIFHVLPDNFSVEALLVADSTLPCLLMHYIK